MLNSEVSLCESKEINIQRLPLLLQRQFIEVVPGSNRESTLWNSKSVTVDSVTYAENDVIITDVVHEEEVPIFGKVKYLLRYDNVWYVCVKVYRTMRFCKHYHAYEVVGTGNWHVLRAQSNRFFQSLDAYEVDGKCMVCLKYKVCLEY